MKILARILLVGLFVGRVWSTDLYVATNGSDSGARDRWSTAYTNIQDALDAAGNGDTVYLAGHFFGLTNQLLWVNHTDVSLRGGYVADTDVARPGNRDRAQWPTVISRVTNDSRVIYIGAITNGLLECLTLTGGETGNNGGYNYSAGLHVTTSRIALVFCTITNNCSKGRGGFGGAIYLNSASVVAMTNCVVSRNRLEALGGNWSCQGGGIYSAGTLTMDHCVLANNVNSISSVGNEWGGGLYVYSGTARLRNCLVAGNTATDGADGFYVNNGALALENCTVAFNGRHGVYRGGGTVAVTNSILWGNVDDVIGTVSLNHCDIEDGDDFGVNGNVASDPRFEYGYYLSLTSSCVNAGTGAVWLTGGSFTTHTNGLSDSGVVDLGFHYQAGFDTAYANLYVATHGNDGNEGTDPAFPVQTLTRALRQARDGTHIQVGAGNYTNGLESFPILAENLNAVTIEGAGPESTVFDASGANTRVLRVKLMKNMTISRMSFVGGKYNAVGAIYLGAGIFVEDSTLTLDDCFITNNIIHPVSGNSTSLGGGLNVNFGSVLTLRNCLVARNGAGTTGGGWPSYGAGLYNEGTLEVVGSVLTGNDNTLHTVGLEYGGLLYNLGEAVFRNSLICGNTATDYGDAFYSKGGTLLLENCTVAFNGKQGICRNGGTVNVTNSILWGNVDDVVGTVNLGYSNIEDGDEMGTNGNISTDPGFEYGYYLNPTGLCVDAGTGGVCLTDSAYTTRTDGQSDTGRVDLGYHYTHGVDFSYALIYVATNGNDVNVGTHPASPLRTLTHALTLATDGSRIILGAGNYTNGSETFPLVVEDINSLMIEGAGLGLTFLNATGANTRVMQFQNVNNSRISGMTICGGKINTTGAAEGAGLRLFGSSLELNACSILGHFLRCQTANGGGIYLDFGSSLRVVDCRIESNTVSSTGSGWPSYGAGIYNAGNLEVRTSVLTSNNNAYTLTGNDYGGALFTIGSARLRNSLIVGNRAGHRGAGCYVAGSLSLENCTLADNSYDGVYRASGTVGITNSILWDNGDDLDGTFDSNLVYYSNIESGGFDQVNGNLATNPLFADQIYYHLKSRQGYYADGYFSGGTWTFDPTESSLLIDAGDPSSPYSEEPYWHGLRINMGAYGNTGVASLSRKTELGTIFIIR